LDDSFILYLPKDIVVGDFYWMSSPTLPPLRGGAETQETQSTSKSPLGGDLEGQQVLPLGEDLGGAVILFAACDCTGHGVPGALVSVVCSNALNRAVKEYALTTPAEILDKVNELVKENFINDDDVKDGMDASICSLNTDNGELI